MPSTKKSTKNSGFSYLPGVFGLVGLAGIVATIAKTRYAKHDQPQQPTQAKKDQEEEQQRKIADQEEQKRIAEQGKKEQQRRIQEEEEFKEEVRKLEERRKEQERKFEEWKKQEEEEKKKRKEQEEQWAKEEKEAEEELERKRQERIQEVRDEQRRMDEEKERQKILDEERRNNIGYYVLLKDLGNMNLQDSDDCGQFEDFQIKIETKEEEKARTAPFLEPSGIYNLGELEDFPKPKTLVGKGGFADIWLACKGAECKKGVYKYVGKVQWLLQPGGNLFRRITVEDFVKEAVIAKYAGEKGFGVPVVTYFRCDKGKYAVIIMKLMKPLPDKGNAMSLDDFKQAVRKIDAMHDHGILHGDLYAKNFVRDPDTSQLLIADFGMAKVFPDPIPPLKRAEEVIGLIYGDGRPALAIGTPKLQKQVFNWYKTFLNNNSVLSEAKDNVFALAQFKAAMHGW